MHVLTGGGAGRGTGPVGGDPELVLEDVLGRNVSAEVARSEYGVVVDEPGLRVDVEATAHLRAERRAVRGPVTWTFDRGVALGVQ